MNQRLRPLAVIFSAALMAMSCPDRDATGPNNKVRPKTIQDSSFGIGNVEWFVPDSGGAMWMQPELDGTQVYFERDRYYLGDTTALPGELVALDRASGSMLWHSPFITAPNAAVAGGFVGAPWGSLPIFDRITGNKTHHFTYATTSLASNIATDGVSFFVGSYDGHALAVDPGTGTLLWDRNLASSSTIARGVAASGNLVVVTLNYYPGTTLEPDSVIVAAVNRSGGAVRWRRAISSTDGGGMSFTPPIVVGGLVIVVTSRHQLIALDFASGVTSWSADASYTSQQISSDGLAACEGNIIVPTGDGGLASFAASNGAPRWHIPDIGLGSLYDIQCAYGTIVAAQYNLRIFNSANGSPIATYPLFDRDDYFGDFEVRSAIRDETSIYVGTSRGFARIKAP